MSDHEHRVVIHQARAVLDAHEVIAGIAPDYSIAYSEWTGEFYVSARVEIGDGTTLAGITEHRPTPQAAVIVYADRLRNVVAPEYIVVDAFRPSTRREYRWLDGRWVEIDRSVAS